jgi:hypothetical protein
MRDPDAAGVFFEIVNTRYGKGHPHGRDHQPWAT